jgi:hypothetical protein
MKKNSAITQERSKLHKMHISQIKWLLLTRVLPTFWELIYPSTLLLQHVIPPFPLLRMMLVIPRQMAKQNGQDLLSHKLARHAQRGERSIKVVSCKAFSDDTDDFERKAERWLRRRLHVLAMAGGRFRRHDDGDARVCGCE